MEKGSKVDTDGCCAAIVILVILVIVILAGAHNLISQYILACGGG